MTPRPFLAITLGDPAGIGPWAAAGAAQDPGLRGRSRPLLVGDAWVLHRRFRRPGVAVKPLASLEEYVDRPGVLNVLHIPHPGIRSLHPGRPQRVGGESAVLSLRVAVTLALAGRAAAIVTGPVSKESFRLAGLPHPGHTELLADLCDVQDVEMVMGGGFSPAAGGAPLLTVLVTRHLPLGEVPKRLTASGIVRSVRRVDAWARRALGLRRPPRWAVCGLNPHAGDNGLLGTEEQRVIGPAVATLRRGGVRVEGPLPADVAWAKRVAGAYDLVASLYHDQGMIPLKTLAAARLINITVGLPFPRTSPGHGTAFDIAAGPRPDRRVDPTPTLEAARAALTLAERTR